MYAGLLFIAMAGAGEGEGVKSAVVAAAIFPGFCGLKYGGACSVIGGVEMNEVGGSYFRPAS
jgi:hypothetical protein